MPPKVRADGAHPSCQVRIPKDASVFFSHHDTATYELMTCTNKRILGWYIHLYNYARSMQHEPTCTYGTDEESVEEDDLDIETEYVPKGGGDCIIV
jgi:hypothetical protein